MDVTQTSVFGFMMLRNGHLQASDFLIARDERDLLIGYDMIPLRGLEQTRKVLASKGLVPGMVEVTICLEHERTCYASTFNGVLHSDMLAYTVCKGDSQATFRTTTSYFGHQRYLQADEQAAVKRHYYFPKKDGRRRSTYAKLTEQVNAIFERHGISVVPIKILPISEGN